MEKVRIDYQMYWKY